jgi:hypothetical protein
MVERFSSIPRSSWAYRDPMAVETLAFTKVEDYRFGFRKHVGTAVIALDPDHPGNGVIVDLDLAARDPDGLVRFETDVVLLQAPDPTNLLHVVANRGVGSALPYSLGLNPNQTGGDIDAGDAWILLRGLSVLWVGWQWDVERRTAAIGVDAPDALGDDGRPIRGQARLEFQPVADTVRRRLADVIPFLGQFQVLPVDDLHDPSAVLTDRDWFNGARRIVERPSWRFVDHEHVELDTGFRARTHYELTYTTSRCPVTGVGLAAVRDVVSHFRERFAHTFAMGVSQSGRWLRQFVFDTGNADESGARVFDGIHCHIAGGRRGEFNHRYAQPSTMNALGFTHLPPFSADDGLLDRARTSGTVPKVICTNTATEYWRGDASLSDPAIETADWRSYLFAGAHHVGQMPGYVDSLPVQLPSNLVEIGWATRAHFAALEIWVTDGVEPPPSAVPRAEDGTGTSRENVLARLPLVEGLVPPDPRALLGMPPIDIGPLADHGVGSFPAKVIGPPRACLVSCIDDDGNEIAGVRLPHVAVPLDISFGWNPEWPRQDIPVEPWNLVGGRIAFSARLVVERYGSRSAFLEQVRSAAESLVLARHLLYDDVELVVADASRWWDSVVATSSAT